MAHLMIVEDQPELASLVEAAARLRGHTARSFHAGTDAIAALEDAAQRFDVAVVDLFLPDVRGSEVLRAVWRHDVPAFAMSGVYKGDRYALEAVEKHGARAFFEKPFQLDALLDAVESAVGKATDPAPAVTDDEPLFPENPELPPPRRLPSERARPLTVARMGPIEEGAVARVMTACFQARHSGELRLRQGQVLKVIAFAQGLPIYAASNVASERFARFCARRGLLSDGDLAAVTALSRGENVPSGEAMVRLGVLTLEQRRSLLEDLVKEIVWSTFGWTTGDYSFSPRAPARADLVPLALFPAAIILEGAAREPLVALRRKMASARRLFPIAEPPYALGDLKLDGPRAHLLAWADGTKSVEDLVALSDLSEKDVLASLYAFELLGLVEERRAQSPRRITFGF